MLIDLSPLAPTYDDVRLLSAKKTRHNTPETEKLLTQIFSNLSAEFKYDSKNPNYHTFFSCFN